jgi:hypothetical protein
MKVVEHCLVENQQLLIQFEVVWERIDGKKC